MFDNQEKVCLRSMKTNGGLCKRPRLWAFLSVLILIMLAAVVGIPTALTITQRKKNENAGNNSIC